MNEDLGDRKVASSMVFSDFSVSACLESLNCERNRTVVFLSELLQVGHCFLILAFCEPVLWCFLASALAFNCSSLNMKDLHGDE